MLRIGLVLPLPLAVALVVTTLVATPAPPVRADGSSLTFSPAPVTVIPGGSFSVDVVITVTQEIRGAQFGLKFDPSVIQISSVSEGTFLKQWATAHHGDSAAAVPFKVDNSKGEVSIGGIILLGGDSKGGPSGTGVLATVKGTAWVTANSVSPISFTSVKFASTFPDASGVPDVIASAGQVSVTPDAGAGNAPVPGQGPQPSNVPGPDMSPPPDQSETGGQSVPPPVAGQSSVNATAPALAAPTDVPAVASSGGSGSTSGAAATPVLASTNAPVVNAAPPAAGAAGAAAPAANGAQSPGASTSAPEVGGAQSPGASTSAPDANAGQQAPSAAPPGNGAVAGQAPAVPAAAATASALQGAIVPVTPPPIQQQPQVPIGAANPTPRPAAAAAPAAADQPGARVTVVPRPVTQAASRPVGSGGLFIPWELVGGIGGGIVTAGLVLFAFRRTAPHPQG